MAGQAVLEILLKVKDQASATLKSINTSTADMSRQFKMAGAAMLGFSAAITAALATTVYAYAEEEKGIIRLRTALKNMGLDYDANQKAIEETINILQEKTAFADDEQRDSLAMLIRATGDWNKALELHKLSMDIAVGANVDLTTANRMVMYALEGSVGMLRRYGVQIEEGATATEALAALQRQFAGQAEQYGKSLAGSFKKVKNSMSDLAESIGAILAPAVEWLAEIVKDLINKFENLPGWIKTTGVVVAIAAVAFAGLGGAMLLLIGYLPAITAGIALLNTQLIALATTVGVTTAGLLGIVAAITAGIAALSIGLYFVYRYKREIAESIPILGRKIRAEDAHTEALRQNALANLDRMGIQHDANTTLHEAAELAKQHVLPLIAQKNAELALADSIKNANDALLQQTAASLRTAKAKGQLAEEAKKLGLTEEEAEGLIQKANLSMSEQEIVAYAAAHEKEELEKIAEDLGISERKLKKILQEANAELARQGTATAGWHIGPVSYLPALQMGGIVKKPTIGLLGEAGPEAIVPLNRSGVGTTIHNYNIIIKAQALLGNEPEARQFARVIADYIRQDQRRKGAVTI